MGIILKIERYPIESSVTSKREAYSPRNWRIESIIPSGSARRSIEKKAVLLRELLIVVLGLSFKGCFYFVVRVDVLEAA